MIYKCDLCGFECCSTALADQHTKRCATGLSENDYRVYLRERANASK